MAPKEGSSPRPPEACHACMRLWEKEKAVSFDQRKVITIPKIGHWCDRGDDPLSHRRKRIIVPAASH